MKTAMELAQEMNDQESAQRAVEERLNANDKTLKDELRCQMTSWIEQVYNSFSKCHSTKEWFAGCEYWVLRIHGQALMSCVLQFVHREAEDIYAESTSWEIMVCPGSWSGPHDHRGTSGISTQEQLNREVAKLMRRHI